LVFTPFPLMSSANGLDQSDNGAASNFAAQRALYERVGRFASAGWKPLHRNDSEASPTCIWTTTNRGTPRTSCMSGDVHWMNHLDPQRFSVNGTVTNSNRSSCHSRPVSPFHTSITAKEKKNNPSTLETRSSIWPLMLPIVISPIHYRNFKCISTKWRHSLLIAG
jgi:hypothetical protein